MPRYALHLSYDGSHFNGWQKQTDDIPTIQSALEIAISTIAGHPINVITAGRTDTGVHATAQIVHFDTQANRPLSAWIRGVNAHLPTGIAVYHAQIVANHFHARFDAISRYYRYLLQSSHVRSPLLEKRVGWTHYPLDIQKMQQAANYLIGEHDFSSFRAAQCQAKSPIKTMYQINISPHHGLIKFDLHANAFLHHMVRNIVGALVYVGSNRLSIQEFTELLAYRSRIYAPPTFMPDGLYLTGVDYPEHFSIKSHQPPEWL